MRFRSRASINPEAIEAEQSVEEATRPGPYDFDDRPAALALDDLADLGGLLFAPAEGMDVHLQVDEATGAVAAVLLANPDGAVELRPFAAPRDGDLWTEILPELRADILSHGGQLADAEGPWGTELRVQFTGTAPDGQEGVQMSRMVGINGPRWMLRATFLGEPAQKPEDADWWHGLLDRVVVRRGTHALPKGEQLPLNLPPEARRVDA